VPPRGEFPWLLVCGALALLAVIAVVALALTGGLGGLLVASKKKKKGES